MKKGKYDHITEEVKKGLDKVFNRFNIIKESIEYKTNHDGRKYYDFKVKWLNKPETEGQFQYWPDVTGWDKGYVEIEDDSFGIGDGPMLELADGYLTKWMYKYHNS
jgi:hypothetical protein